MSICLSAYLLSKGYFKKSRIFQIKKLEYLIINLYFNNTKECIFLEKFEVIFL